MDPTLCPTCGAAAALDARFCPSCGTPLLVKGDDALFAHVQRALAQEFDIVREIGRGGMAAVYLATDLRLPRKVALKVMLPELAYAESMPQRFLGEARLAAMLDHPNIVPIYRAGESGGIRFFAMRYINGCSLEQLLRVEPRLPIALSCYLLADTARALDFAHGEGVVHRDVKPGNVMLDQRWGRAIVTDFGIAKLTHAENLTRTGFAIGTPAYMSPELCRGAAPSSASDQYALGIVAYQLLTGSPPFVGTELEVQMAQLRDTPRPIRDVCPECPAELEAAVLRMIEKAPEARWPCLGDVLSVLLRHVGLSEAAQQEELRRRLGAIAPGQEGSLTPRSPMPSRSLSPLAIPVTDRRDGDATPGREGGTGGTGGTGGAPPERGAGMPLGLVASLQALVITPAETAVEAGATAHFDVQGVDASGRPVPGLMVTWSTDDARVAVVAGPGTVAALSEGATRVVARVGGHEATATLRVHAGTAAPVDMPVEAPPEAASLTLLPGRVQLLPGATARLRAVAMRASGEVLDGPELAWRVTDTQVAALDTDGGVRALAPGKAEVVVTLGRLVARTEVVVARVPNVSPVGVGLPFPPPPTTAVWPRDLPRAATVDTPARETAPPVITSSGESPAGPSTPDASEVEASEAEASGAEPIDLAVETPAGGAEEVSAAEVAPPPRSADSIAFTTASDDAASGTTDERPGAHAAAIYTQRGLGDPEPRRAPGRPRRLATLGVAVAIVAAAAYGVVWEQERRAEADRVRLARLDSIARADSIRREDAVRLAAASEDSARRQAAADSLALVDSLAADSAFRQLQRDSARKAGAPTAVAAEIKLPISAPSGGVIGIGDTFRLHLNLLDSTGRTIGRQSGARVGWRSRDQNVITVTRDGLVTGRRVGESVIEATYGRLRARDRALRVGPRTVAAVETTPNRTPPSSGRAGGFGDSAAVARGVNDAMSRMVTLLRQGNYDAAFPPAATAAAGSDAFRNALIGWLGKGEKLSVEVWGSLPTPRPDDHMVRFELLLKYGKPLARLGRLKLGQKGDEQRVVNVRAVLGQDPPGTWRFRDAVLTKAPEAPRR